MSQNEIEALGERIAWLERETRLWKRGAAAMMALVGALIALSFATGTRKARAAGTAARELVVRKVTVVDEQGIPRVELAAEKRGSGLAVLDEHGKRSASLWVGEYAIGLTLVDLGMPRVALTIQKQGPELMLFDEKSPRIVLAVSEDGQSELGL